MHKGHDFLKHTWFGRLRISYTKWLLLIKLFEVGTNARTASSQAGIRYPAALKSYDIMRISILRRLARQRRILRGQIEADEAYFGGRRKGNRGSIVYIDKWHGYDSLMFCVYKHLSVDCSVDQIRTIQYHPVGNRFFLGHRESVV